MKKITASSFIIILSIIGFFGFKNINKAKVTLEKNARIALVGNNLGSRMLNYDYFETELQLRHPGDSILVRNLCDGGDTPGFRPHSARFTPWAFPGAEKFQKEYANSTESEGHFDTHDQWLTNFKTDVVIGFFGFNESFQGMAGVANFKAELQAFINHTKAQMYNGQAAPKLVLVSPTAYEDISAKIDVPNGKAENQNLMLYAAAIKEIALKNKVPFVDVFSASKEWYAAQTDDLTIDGLQLNKAGYKIFGEYLANQIFGTEKHVSNHEQLVYDAVMEKNWMWHNDYKIPNGVHVYGRRYNPFGPDNYPMEIEKIRQMTAIRDRAIWMAASDGKSLDIAKEDAATRLLPEVKTNYNPEANGSLTYLSGDAATNSLKMAPGYKIELFASEVEFPDLAKPVQITFDNKGRLWVACMPSYPHYKPGDPRPNDKLIILEDTDKNGKADKQTIFADKLHVPVGFEISHDGVYVSQGTNLILLKDTNNDDKADTKEIILSGFDDHDTHHTASAFVADESGAIVMEEGVFLQTNVETAYGPVRASNGGFYRYNPKRRHLERLAQLAIPNPWGVAFDKFGQNFFAETSSPDMRWMMPGTIFPRYGESNPKSKNLIEEAQRVRPTSGLEFVHSRHFPDEIQGDLLINNTIGFLGMKQHQMLEDGTGFQTKFRQDMIVSSDKNFRAVDMEFAPDGSLYVIDWHNILIGHMQHNARDPLRDHLHGRVYRITYPSRPLITPPSIAGASIETLLDNLKLPEYRARYATRRELRGRNVDEVLGKMQTWIQKLDPKEADYEHHLLEAMWVNWGLNKIDQNLVRQLLNSKDHKVRAAAVRALRYNAHQIKDTGVLLTKAAGDEHGRVRMEAFVAASWMGKTIATPVFLKAKTKPLDEWMKPAYEAAWAHVNGQNAQKIKEVYSTTNIKGKDLELFTLGRTLYAKEGNCITCHQSTGSGLPASGFPPLAGSKWVTGDKDRLIKLVLKGMMGPLEINGVKYTGDVPMTPYGGLFNDRQMAGVLTYVRNSFGNQASAIQPEDIKKIRAMVAGKKDIYNVNELLTEHPLEK
jgi:mono/diheme cytochrome c family protein/glucose/arabinose dehydrogenase